VIGSLIYSPRRLLNRVWSSITKHAYVTGEPDGSRSERIKKIAEAADRFRVRAPVTTHLRQRIWVKILAMWLLIPSSALTGATLAQDAEQHGNYESNSQYHAGDGSADRETGREDAGFYRAAHAGAAKVGEHKTSTLQDLEAGRPLELKRSSARCWKSEKESFADAAHAQCLRLYQGCWPNAGAPRRKKLRPLRGQHEQQAVDSNSERSCMHDYDAPTSRYAWALFVKPLQAAHKDWGLVGFKPRHSFPDF